MSKKSSTNLKSYQTIKTFFNCRNWTLGLFEGVMLGMTAAGFFGAGTGVVISYLMVNKLSDMDPNQVAQEIFGKPSETIGVSVSDDGPIDTNIQEVSNEKGSLYGRIKGRISQKIVNILEPINALGLAAEFSRSQGADLNSGTMNQKNLKPYNLLKDDNDVSRLVKIILNTVYNNEKDIIQYLKGYYSTSEFNAKFTIGADGRFRRHVGQISNENMINLLNSPENIFRRK